MSQGMLVPGNAKVLDDVPGPSSCGGKYPTCKGMNACQGPTDVGHVALALLVMWISTLRMPRGVLSRQMDVSRTPLSGACSSASKEETPHDAMEDGRGNAPFIPPFTAASFCTESGILTSRQVAPGNGWGEPCGVGGGRGCGT